MLKLRFIDGIKVVSTVMGILFILVLVLPLLSAHADVNGAATTPKISLIAIVVFIILVVFVGILVAGWYGDHRNLDKGEMRRAIAGVFVVGFTIIVFLSIVYDIELSEIVLMYIELTGIVIGYYFGARTAKEKRAEAAAKITIEHMKFVYDDDPKKRKIILTIRNGGDTEIKVDKIYVNEVAYETSVKIESQKSKVIEEFHEWKYETEYKIKIATTTGLTDEISRLSPKEKQK
jgi:hypothetical protein